MRVQILIWFQTFLLFTKPHFQAYDALKSTFLSGISDYFGHFHTFSHTPDSVRPSFTIFPTRSEEFLLVQSLLKKSTRVLNGFPSWWGYNDQQFWACWLGLGIIAGDWHIISCYVTLLTEDKIWQVSVLWIQYVMWGLAKMRTLKHNSTIMNSTLHSHPINNRDGPLVNAWSIDLIIYIFLLFIHSPLQVTHYEQTDIYRYNTSILQTPVLL